MLGDLNARVGRATNGLGDLRVFVPLGLGVLTVRQIFRHGLKLDDLPWYVTVWYAYQSFITRVPAGVWREKKRKICNGKAFSLRPCFGSLA